MAATPDQVSDDLRPEYDLAALKGRVLGKYHARSKSRLHLVRLSPDVAAAFPTEESVNQALRLLIDLARQQVPKPAA
jgi:hypothetical protein